MLHNFMHLLVPSPRAVKEFAGRTMLQLAEKLECCRLKNFWAPEMVENAILIFNRNCDWRTIGENFLGFSASV
jgi:hypothetical protein